MTRVSRVKKLMIKQKNTAARISTEVHTKVYFSYHSLILEILRGKKKYTFFKTMPAKHQSNKANKCDTAGNSFKM